MKKTKFHILTVFLAVMLSFTAFSMTAYAGGGPEEEETLPEETEPTIEPGEPLSEDTDIVTRDLLYDKATNKQFLTIEDRAGNVFYLVIDYDAPVNEDEEQYKTYFLNPVDTDDLAALAEESEEKPVACVCTERCAAGAVNMNCPVCSANTTECAGTAIDRKSGSAGIAVGVKCSRNRPRNRRKKKNRSRNPKSPAMPKASWQFCSYLPWPEAAGPMPISNL